MVCEESGIISKGVSCERMIDRGIPMKPPYPDISSIFAAKRRRRQTLAKLSWEEKIAIVEQMQLLLPKGMWKDRAPGSENATSKEKCPSTQTNRPVKKQ